MWIVRLENSDTGLPYLKHVAPGATHWDDKIQYAARYDTKEEAEVAAFRVTIMHPWAFGKLFVVEVDARPDPTCSLFWLVTEKA